MLEPQVRVDVLPFFGGNQGVGPHEVDFGLGADDVGNDTSGMLVGIYFREQPLYKA